MQGKKSKGTIVSLFDQKFVIKEFPTIGQLIEIKNVKTGLTSGNYSMLASDLSIAGSFNIDLVDGIATFSILLGKDFSDAVSTLTEGKTAFDLPGIYAREIVREYRKFFGWYKEFLTELYADEIDSTVEEIEEDEKK